MRPRPLANPLVAGSMRHAPCSTQSRRAAFTLIELLVVVAIIAILAGLTLSTLGYVNRKGAESRARSEVAALSAAIDSFYIDYSAYPASNNLYRELTGQTNANALNTSGKVYFEPTPSITGSNGNTPIFQDPWGAAYNYTTNPVNNVGFYDLWTSNNVPKDPAQWIRN
jgi:prepilin-type N-terminal cleavage/methylation domain-containing protein